MGRQGLLIGEVAARGGVSRKALRLYEATGILPRPSRTPAGYRLYSDEALDVLTFVTQARRLGFSLAEIKEIVTLKRSGHPPCPKVRALVRQRTAELDRKLTDLAAVRQGLRELLGSWRSRRGKAAVVCPHIEHATRANGRRR